MYPAPQSGFCKIPGFFRSRTKIFENFRKFRKNFPRNFFRKNFPEKVLSNFPDFPIFPKFPPEFPPKRFRFLACQPCVAAVKPRKNRKKPGVFPPEFPGIPGEIPPGIFRETAGIRKETRHIFPQNLWGKHPFPKRILTKSPPVFRKSPGGLFDGFLTIRRRKKFPSILCKTFPEIFPSEFFPKFPESFLTKFFWKKFPTIFENVG